MLPTSRCMLVALAGAALLCVLLLLALRQPAPTRLDVGTPADDPFLAGFYLPETHNGADFRWSSPKARLLLHGAGVGPLRLEMRLFANPDQQQRLETPRSLRLYQQGQQGQPAQTFAAFELHTEPTWRVYRVLLPPGAVADAGMQTVPVRFETSAYTPGIDDGRRLGVPLDWLHLTPLPGGSFGSTLPLLWRVALLVGGVALLVGWLARLLPGARSQQTALLLGAAVALVLVGGAVADAYRLAWMLPPTPWLLGLLALLLLATRAPIDTGERWRPWLALLLLVIAQGVLATQAAIVAGAVLAGAGSVLLATTPTPAPLTDSPPAPGFRWGAVGLLLVFLLAVGLRLYRIDDLPYGLWRDEGRHGLMALRILEDPDYRPVYEPDGGIHLPGLGFYPLAFSLHVWGIHAWGMRPITALAGALTVLPLYGLVWQMFRRVDVALLAAALLAVSSWHLTLSRFSFPTIFDPLLTLTGLWLLVWALDSPRRPRLALLSGGLAGISLGMAVQTYHTGRVVPLVAGLLLLLLLLHRRQAWRHWLRCMGLLLLGFALTVGPLVGYALRYPESFHDRVGDVSLLGSIAQTKQAPLTVLDDSLGRHVLAFNARGDTNGRHHAPGAPLLDWLTGLGLLAGGALLLRHWRDWRSQFIIGALLLTLAPSMLAVNGPHAMRSIGAAAFACSIAALGWVAMLMLLRHAAPQRLARLPLARTAGVLVVGGALLLNSWLYFGSMATDERVWRSFYPVHTQMGSYLREMADLYGPQSVERVYVDEYLTRNDVFRFLTHRLPVQHYNQQGLSRPPGEEALFLLSGYTYQQDTARLTAYLGLQPEMVWFGPALPGTFEPSFVVYRARLNTAERTTESRNDE